MSGRCSLLSCGERVVETVDHPERGPMAVCAWHARQIRRLERGVSVDA